MRAPAPVRAQHLFRLVVFAAQVMREGEDLQVPGGVSRAEPHRPAHRGDCLARPAGNRVDTAQVCHVVRVIRVQGHRPLSGCDRLVVVQRKQMVVAQQRVRIGALLVEFQRLAGEFGRLLQGLGRRVAPAIARFAQVGPGGSQVSHRRIGLEPDHLLKAVGGLHIGFAGDPVQGIQAPVVGIQRLGPAQQAPPDRSPARRAGASHPAPPRFRG